MSAKWVPDAFAADMPQSICRLPCSQMTTSAHLLVATRTKLMVRLHHTLACGR